MDSRPIGVFDSGVGGLTVVKAIMKTLPKENIIYFGDTARVPYGSKTKETVSKFSSQIIRFLKEKNVKVIVIACNTVSSNCYEELVLEFPEVHIVEVVGPGVESCINSTKNNVVGVIGTEATIGSGAYERRLKESNPNITVYSKACPLFVPLAEEGWVFNDVSKKTAEIYLKELVEKEIDSLLLGCTHYPLLTKCLGEVVGENVKIVNPAKATAAKVKEYLKENDMQNENLPNRYTFFVSDNNAKFDLVCNRVLGQSFKAIKTNIERC